MSMHAFPSGFICYSGGANKKLDYDVLYMLVGVSGANQLLRGR